MRNIHSEVTENSQENSENEAAEDEPTTQQDVEPSTEEITSDSQAKESEFEGDFIVHHTGRSLEKAIMEDKMTRDKNNRRIRSVDEYRPSNYTKNSTDASTSNYTMRRVLEEDEMTTPAEGMPPEWFGIHDEDAGETERDEIETEDPKAVMKLFLNENFPQPTTTASYRMGSPYSAQPFEQGVADGAVGPFGYNPLGFSTEGLSLPSNPGPRPGDPITKPRHTPVFTDHPAEATDFLRQYDDPSPGVDYELENITFATRATTKAKSPTTTTTISLYDMETPYDIETQLPYHYQYTGPTTTPSPEDLKSKASMFFANPQNWNQLTSPQTKRTKSSTAAPSTPNYTLPSVPLPATTPIDRDKFFKFFFFGNKTTNNHNKTSNGTHPRQLLLIPHLATKRPTRNPNAAAGKRPKNVPKFNMNKHRIPYLVTRPASTVNQKVASNKPKNWPNFNRSPMHFLTPVTVKVTNVPKPPQLHAPYNIFESWKLQLRTVVTSHLRSVEVRPTNLKTDPEMVTPTSPVNWAVFKITTTKGILLSSMFSYNMYDKKAVVHLTMQSASVAKGHVL